MRWLPRGPLRHDVVVALLESLGYDYPLGYRVHDPALAPGLADPASPLSNERKFALAKILFIVVLLLVAFVFFKNLRKDSGKDDRRRPPEGKLPEDMVRCEVCGVNLPRSEAFITQNRLYCSDEHRKIGLNKDA